MYRGDIVFPMYRNDTSIGYIEPVNALNYTKTLANIRVMAMSGTGSSNSIRGIRIGAGIDSASVNPPNPEPEPAELVADPARPRRVLDYSLARRSVLEEVKRDALMKSGICDADPYLIRAAKHHGEQTERPCPICNKSDLVHVTYTFGGDLGYYSGRIRESSELPAMAYEYGNFKVYVVEVCTHCEWNHLHMSYVLGDGVPRTPPRKPRDVLE